MKKRFILISFLAVVLGISVFSSSVFALDTESSDDGVGRDSVTDDSGECASVRGNCDGEGETGRTYSDVEEGERYSIAVDFITERGVVEGYEDGTYRPESTLNRAELLKIVVASNYSEDEYDSYDSENCFDDVKAGEWYTKYVCFAKDKGIVQGYEDGTFKPGDEINFVEAVKMTLLSFGVEYEDTEDVWYRGLVKSAAKNRFIPSDVEDFGQEFSRGQMADLITRVLKSEGEEGDLDVYLENIVEFGGAYNLTYESIQAKDDVSTEKYTWKLSTNATDLQNYLNGKGTGYSKIRELVDLAGIGNYFYVFCLAGVDGDSYGWGWTTFKSDDAGRKDLIGFLNGDGGVDFSPKSEARIFQSKSSIYLFYKDCETCLEGGYDWSWKFASNIDDVYNFVNSSGSYEGLEKPLVFSFAADADNAITVLYRKPGQGEVDNDYKWGWKKALDIDDAYNFVNGFGEEYGDPVEDFVVYGVQGNPPPFYIFYRD